MKKQRGAALVVVLSLLAMSLMLGISGMQSSQIDERLAGNYRSGTLAAMAAEYGASAAWAAILDIEVGNASESTFINALDDEVGLGLLHGLPDSNLTNVYYRINVDPSPGLDTPVRVRGEVYEGGSQAVLISFREMEIFARLNGLGGGNLSPLNVPATLDNYEGIKSQAGVTGEDIVDGTRNPAITAASKEEAQKIVNDIVGSNGADKYVFVPDGDGSGNGVFYAAPTIVDGEYTGNYSSCNSGNNRLCNYMGGIATRPKDSILTDANLFHNFISAIFDDAYGSNGSGALSNGMSGFNVISTGAHFDQNDNYRPSRYLDGEELPGGGTCQSDVCYPTRQEFTGSGNAAGDGVLIIDGDVTFNGNPEFKGLIIVLGSYTVKGGGGGDMEGAIIAAPYSCRPGGDCHFDKMNIEISGGGGNDYLHNMTYLDAAWDILGSISPEAARQWLQGNNPGGIFTYLAHGWRDITM
ncbi:pilus assembly PilX family protein [Billgrantia ethanolica]|uniref:Type 4 fimbrial biogenesis protein PilX N-terminal domain-containing protein n=1 Tax=Billgrantia ethanolica TaxID=2733486 RepID=A0ABS9A308_9GAMM|nr:pilus assembly PilX N-terminal domain-containing protein [Halomonas ethanolica]MCE8003010.1 hypothetical protein [Halomonas ethanolica]